MNTSATAHRARGITLIELMIVLGVIGIIAAISAPSLQNLIRNNRITAQSNELSAAISYARNAATNNTGEVQMSLSSDSGSTWSAETRDMSCTPNPCVIQRLEYSNANLVTGDLNLTFSSRGLLASSENIALQHVPCSGQGQRAALEVLLSGAVRKTYQACQ